MHNNINKNIGYKTVGVHKIFLIEPTHKSLVNREFTILGQIAQFYKIKMIFNDKITWMK